MCENVHVVCIYIIYVCAMNTYVYITCIVHVMCMFSVPACMKVYMLCVHIAYVYVVCVHVAYVYTYAYIWYICMHVICMFMCIHSLCFKFLY